MNIAQFTFNPFQENTYVVWDDSDSCIIVDAGCYTERDYQTLFNFVRDNNLKPVMAVNTHGHIDHILGVSRVVEHYGIPFAMHGSDEFLLRSADTHAELYGFKFEKAPILDIDLADMKEIMFGDTAFRIIHTPGHTPGHVSLYEEKSGTVFTGDTLFRESIGRTDLPGGDYGWIMKSIIDGLLTLGENTAVYPGHGQSTTIGHEMLYNPFITEVMEGDVRPV